MVNRVWENISDYIMQWKKKRLKLKKKAAITTPQTCFSSFSQPQSTQTPKMEQQQQEDRYNTMWALSSQHSNSGMLGRGLEDRNCPTSLTHNDQLATWSCALSQKSQLSASHKGILEFDFSPASSMDRTMAENPENAFSHSSSAQESVMNQMPFLGWFSLDCTFFSPSAAGTKLKNYLTTIGKRLDTIESKLDCKSYSELSHDYIFTISTWPG